ncbi:MAG: AAA family ATPase [Candidatus Paceibacterota bacterium]
MPWKTIGFGKIKRFFEGAIAGSHLNHAYIFSGQDEIGKKTFALELAERLSGNSHDILFLTPDNSDSGQSIAIDEVRKLKSFMSLSSYGDKYKVAVIDEAHLMTVEAQNALLKLLEEPSKSSMLILVTSVANSLLPTIASRCQEIRFLPHSKEEIASILGDSKLAEAQNNFLAEFSNGRIGLIKRILEEKSYDEVRESVEELMNLVKVDLNERFAIAQKLSDDKKGDISRKVIYWMLYARMRIGEPQARRILKNLLQLQGIIGHPQFNRRLALENFVLTL